MPIYEYRCQSCGHELEALQKIADAPLSECPECSEAALKRLMSAPSFRLKGSGWYETDFKSDKERKRNLAGESKGGGDSSGGESKGAGDAAGKAGSGKDGAAAASTSDKPSGKSAEGASQSTKPKPETKAKSGSKGTGSEAA